MLKLFGVCLNLEFFIFPDQTGTATSSPTVTTASQSDLNIVNVMLWMKRNAYEESTIKKVAKLLRHLKKNCKTQEPEEVKLYIANKTCGNGHKDTRSTERYISLFDEKNITWIPVIAETDEEIKQAIQDDCILVCQANGKTFFKKPA